MSTHILRLGLIAFLILGSAAVINMVMLQPNAGRLSTARQGPAAAASGTVVQAVARGAPARPSTDSKGGKGNVAAVTSNPGTGSNAIATPASVTAATSRSADKDAGRVAYPPTPVHRPDVQPDPLSQSVADMLDVTKALQRELKIRGYETGSADGQPGLMTRAAIMAYEHDRDLPLTGEPSAQLLKLVLQGGPPIAAATEPRPNKEQSVQATQVIRTVQQSLVTLGYVPGKVDGRAGEDTVRAIREFEIDQGLPETGRVSGQLVARLARLAGQGRIATGGR